MKDKPDMLAAALWYAEQGAPVLPLHYPVPIRVSDYTCSCSVTECPSPAKHPIASLVPHGLDDATTDPEALTRWWAQYPSANIGLRTGETFDALDLDGPAGFAAYTEMVTALGSELEAFAVVRTGRPDGGRQHYCQPAGRRNFAGGKNGIPAGVDCRGTGGYVVAVPSRHISGRRYEWITRWGTNGHAGAAWPDAYEWLTAQRALAAPLPPPKPLPVVVQGVGTPYGLAALQSECDTIRSTPEGARNDQLNASAFNLGQLVTAGQLDEADAARQLLDAALAAGLDEREARRTIESGMPSGEARPRTPPAPAVTAPTTAPAPLATATPEPAPEPAPVDTLTLDEQALKFEIRQQRIRRQARRTLDGEEAADAFPWPVHLPTLADDLAEPDEEVPFVIDQLFPAGGNVLLTAQYKTGKTTLVNETARALADGGPFLDKFQIGPHPGRVVIFNFEMSANMYRRWWRDVGCVQPQRITLVHLRGIRLPLLAPITQEWCVATLQDMHCQTWIVDPWARAFAGSGDENSNSDVGVALDVLDSIKERAGVANLLLATHTGRGAMDEGAERARGATRLDDWADVRWLLTRDKNDARFLRATGRDVEVDEEGLAFDLATRRLAFGGGDRAWQRRRRVQSEILDYVAAHPGCGVREIEANVMGGKDVIGGARQSLISNHEIRVEMEMRSRSVKHFLNMPHTLGGDLRP